MIPNDTAEKETPVSENTSGQPPEAGAPEEPSKTDPPPAAGESAETVDSTPPEGEAPENTEKELEEQLARERDRFLRLSAEFENYKRRKSREVDNFKRYANEEMIKQLLPVVDNLERAILSCRESGDACQGVLDGVELTLRDILKIFDSQGVQPVEAIGKPFNPEFHEAVMQQPSDTVAENTVIKELQKGYVMHDRLIRPAMVIVSTAPRKTDDGSEA